MGKWKLRNIFLSCTVVCGRDDRKAGVIDEFVQFSTQTYYAITEIIKIFTNLV
jgi:hypothetical protein